MPWNERPSYLTFPAWSIPRIQPAFGRQLTADGQKRIIVLTTYGSLGDLHPYLALAFGLKARGHQPVMATSAYYRRTIEAAGLEQLSDPISRLRIKRGISG